MAKSNKEDEKKEPTGTPPEVPQVPPVPQIPEAEVAEAENELLAAHLAIETLKAENENLREVVNEQEAKLSDQAATIANMMKDVSTLVTNGGLKPSAIVEHEGNSYKMCSPMVIVDQETYNAVSLQKNPKAIARILATPGQKTLNQV